MLDSLKDLFSGGKDRRWESKGRGVKLGAAPPPPGPSKDGHVQHAQQQQQQQQQQQHQSQKKSVFEGEGRKLGSAPNPPLTPVRPAEQPVQVSNTPTGKERRVLQEAVEAANAVKQKEQSQSQVSEPGAVASVNTPTRQERDLGLLHEDMCESDEHLQTCLALVVSHGGDLAQGTLELLMRISHNVLADPHANKFRQVRLSSPKVRQCLEVPGFMEFMEGVGFVLCSRESEDGMSDLALLDVVLCSSNLQLITSSDRNYAVLPANAPLKRLRIGEEEIRRMMRGLGMTPPLPSLMPPPNLASASSIASSLSPAPAPSAIPGAVPDGCRGPSKSAPEGGPDILSSLHQSDPLATGASGRLASAASAGPSRLRNASKAAMSEDARSSGGERSSAGSQQQGERLSAGSQQQQQQGAVPVERGTQVLLPVTPDTSIPDSFFERTPAEVKEEYARLVRARTQNQTIATRAMREQWAGGAGKKGPRPTRTTLRVRFPEGVVLQGMFGVREACTSVHEWVAQALHFPGACYELMMPNRKAMPVAGSIRDCPDVIPSAMLNFRLTGEYPLHLFQQPSFLRDEMLLLTRPE